MTDKEKQIVANSSKAYGYNYASLADIARAGFKIPKMRVKPLINPVTGEWIRDYIEYYDEELNVWSLGAPIVVPEMKGSNEAQREGSAITYAARYTTARYYGIATDEDEKVEKQAPAKAEPKKIKGGMDLDEIKTKLSNLKTPDEIRAFYAEYVKVHELTDKQKELLTKVCEDRKNNLDKKSFFKAKVAEALNKDEVPEEELPTDEEIENVE